jgi:DNA repair protein RadA/Sms
MIGEVQALSNPPEGPPRRTVSGIDSARAAMISAVLERHGSLPLARSDLYVATVGGMRLTDPSADLAIAMAIMSSCYQMPLPMDVVTIGEVGLAGDLRRVSGLDRRLAEAARLGFNTAVVPPGITDTPAGMRVITADNIRTALRAVREIAENNGRS